MILFFLIATCIAIKPETFSISIDRNTGVLTENNFTGSVHARYSREINETGWNYLTIWVTDQFINSTQSAYGMGYVEGHITRHDIDEYWKGFVSNTWRENEPSQYIMNKLKEQRSYWRRNLDKPTYFHKAQKIIEAQFRGLYDGYKAAGGSLSEDEMYLMASRGDLYEILNMYPYSIKSGSFADIRNKRGRGEIHSCSAFVRNVNGTVLFAHNTWTTYTRMFRIKKIYEYNTEFGVVAIDQTSYPGILVSIDDYYSVHRNVYDTKFIMETTNSIYSDKLYIDFTKRHLYWQRVLAGLIAGKTSDDILNYFAHDSSATYNNQWIVFDVNVWKQENKTGALMIMEEMPNIYRKHDVTEYLLDPEKNNSWTSYNIPYDMDIAKASGIPMSDDCTPHEDARRAMMFRRDMSSINSIEDAMRYIRYNNYVNDTLSSAVPDCTREFNATDARSPMFAIAARGDLLSSHYLYGAIDGKVMSSEYPLRMYIVSGPTNDNLETFRFSDHGKVVPGIPNEWDFDWVVVDFVEDQQDFAYIKAILIMVFLVLMLL